MFGKKVWPIKVKSDNQAVIQVVTGNGETNLRRHLAVKYYALQEWFEQGLFVLEYVASKHNVTDMFTKQVGGSFDELREKLIEPQGR